MIIVGKNHKPDTAAITMQDFDLITRAPRYYNCGWESRNKKIASL